MDSALPSGSSSGRKPIISSDTYDKHNNKETTNEQQTTNVTTSETDTTNATATPGETTVSEADLAKVR